MINKNNSLDLSNSEYLGTFSPTQDKKNLNNSNRTVLTYK